MPIIVEIAEEDVLHFLAQGVEQGLKIKVREVGDAVVRLFAEKIDELMSNDKIRIIIEPEGAEDENL